MILNALFIYENRIIEQFDTEKHSEEEEKNFRNKYPSKYGFCISSVEKIEQKKS